MIGKVLKSILPNLHAETRDRNRKFGHTLVQSGAYPMKQISVSSTTVQSRVKRARRNVCNNNNNINNGNNIDDDDDKWGKGGAKV